MNINTFISTANTLATGKTPFIFLLDFEMEKPLIYTLDEAAQHGIHFDIKGHSNIHATQKDYNKTALQIYPVSKNQYHSAFDIVKKELQQGNTYLINLTFPTHIQAELNFINIFHAAEAPYRLLKADDFVLYSPECFVQISGDTIRSFPMKGTIDASVEGAEQMLLNNQKEIYEHNTIVDLIRNDLALVAHNITVERFRYIDRVKRPQGELLQVSSEISGTLPPDWREHLGDLLVKLLPAGSVSGAPKQKTCEIIYRAEKEKRGYYTGIFGIFDGEHVDSAVNIRFVEKKADGYYYRSGGGITALSDCESEYNEMIEKVYVPTFI